jgi:hypothetical protein
MSSLRLDMTRGWNGLGAPASAFLIDVRVGLRAADQVCGAARPASAGFPHASGVLSSATIIVAHRGRRRQASRPRNLRRSRPRLGRFATMGVDAHR